MNRTKKNTENATDLIDRLEKDRILAPNEFLTLLSDTVEETSEYLYSRARAVRHSIYGNTVYIRGLIELTSYCKNDCLYCGIRQSNERAKRYRLSNEQVLSCAEKGYNLGFRTFVLQGGEDPYYSDELLTHMITSLKTAYPDCAITLSLGEKSRESYLALFHAGADRYLLRHETADDSHYSKLHPKELTLSHRMSCLYDLNDIGFQVGCGLMVGSPFQTMEHLIKDLLFIKEFNPHMVGCGPFIPHKDTPFAKEPAGNVDLTLKILAIVRLMLPGVLLPATTALGTVDSFGREKGILAGANVVMPNLSPLEVRSKYLLYDNKLSTGNEAAESLMNLRKSMEHIGYSIAVDRGDYIAKNRFTQAI